MTVPFNPQDEARVRRELDEGERLLWLERPSPGEVAMRGCGTSIVGLFMMGFAVFWMVGAFSVKGSGLFPLFGLLFLGMGAWVALTPLIKSNKAANTFYALTDRRALIIEDGYHARVQSFGPRDIEPVERRERGNGLGDLVFARRMVRGGGKHHHYIEQQIGFMSTPRVREAERFLREYLLSANETRAEEPF